MSYAMSLQSSVRTCDVNVGEANRISRTDSSIRLTWYVSLGMG
jgi:hypothetical protein